LREKKILNVAKVQDVYKKVNEEIEEAVRFAESSPLPLPEDTLLDVYAG
jgi:TPP-dependent pyruvate/acetoin dehydrogenase alpha subunit